MVAARFLDAMLGEQGRRMTTWTWESRGPGAVLAGVSGDCRRRKRAAVRGCGSIPGHRRPGRAVHRDVM